VNDLPQESLRAIPVRRRIGFRDRPKCFALLYLRVVTRADFFKRVEALADKIHIHSRSPLHSRIKENHARKLRHPCS
jgi:hypothetical protein